MDSVHKLIEMLEKRFGKLPADALLVIVGLGAAAWGVNTFVTDLVLPVALFVQEAIKYFRGAPLTLSKQAAFQLFVQVGVSCVLGVVFAIIIRFAVKKWTERGNALAVELTEMLNQIKEGRSEVKNIIAEARTIIAATESLRDESLEALKKADSVREKAEALVTDSALTDRQAEALPSPEPPTSR